MKTCIYTICKNDSKFIDKWFDSLKDYDCIAAVVHDSKDNTAEKLLAYGAKIAFTHYQNEPNTAEEDALNFAKQVAPDCDNFVFTPINRTDEYLSDDASISEQENRLVEYYYGIKNYEEAYRHAIFALALDPENEQKKHNCEVCRRLIVNKVCVYTVCRNESEFVEKWVENNKDADHIVALVHDCTDDTAEKLRALNVDVGYGFYNEWRFDNGKNDSMHLAYSLAPECNIFVFTSLDEFWETKDWVRIVKECWDPETTKQCWYNFVQTHDEFENDTGITHFNWMTSRDPKWHWEYPIHESISYGDNEEVKDCINLFNVLKLQHRPKKGKVRSYMDLHKLRWEEYKDDISCLYLIRENIIHGFAEEAYRIAKDFDHEHTDLQPEENAYIWMMEGMCLEYFGRTGEALKCYENAYEVDKSLRSPLIRAGLLYAKCEMYSKAEEIIEKALNETSRNYTWLEDPWDWRSKPYYWLSYINLKLGNKEKALGYALFAYQIDSTDDLKEYYEKVLKECTS